MVQLQTVLTPHVLTPRTGWALTLLSEENLSYASTCQTIGLNTGYFASFTVFMALNSEAFRYGSVFVDGFHATIFIDRAGPYLVRDGAYRCYLLALTFVSGV
jgi:Acetyl-coenzyme A transporter 1